MTNPRSVHDLMRECGDDLPARFTSADVVGWFATHHPDVPASTVRTRLARVTGGSAGQGSSGSAPVFRRVQRGVYELIAPGDATRGPAPGSAVLFVVPTTRHPDEAQRRKRARLFADSKHEAHRNGERWFGLSSHYGLIYDVDASPADILMSDVPSDHGDTWASWISIRLDAAMGSVRGKRVRIDAPGQYTDLLRPALESRGADVEVSTAPA